MNKLIILILVVWFILTPYKISAIQYRDILMIQIAYKNGFDDAFDLDIETYKKLKKDRNLLKQTAHELSQKYLEEVNRMN